MTTKTWLVCALTAWISGSGTGIGAGSQNVLVEVLVDGRPLTLLHHGGVRYIEAVKGREYAIRLHNPFDVRVAVALSVDGLNSIDARRTTSAAARKWVLDPHQTVVIEGWQTSQDQARRFYFTAEERSYARALGEGDNLGIISAAFFRERTAVVPTTPVMPEPGAARRQGSAARERSGDVGAGRDASAPAMPAAEPRSAEEYAATGIGRRTRHRVEQVALDLEAQPAAVVDLRYEYRDQLVRLGVIPPRRDALARREAARGFAPGYCPEPPRPPRQWPVTPGQNWK